ncbi:MAG: NAD(P)H-hydrate dehydratase, partial [Gemmatimonadetes bacterium]|nr:NAD(P)H-hydrate dehydratase [Gemmatimonadota bacterium]
RTLAAWGRPVAALPAAARGPDALLHGWTLEGWPSGKVEPAAEADAARLLAGADVVVDGVLGTGARGEAREPQARFIRAINAAGRAVVALDIPSGTDATTGDVPGDAVRAAVTIAFGWPKRGTLFQPARALAGRLVAVEIGFPPAGAEPSPFAARLITPCWASAHLPRRAADAHKGSTGQLLLVAGRAGMAGAAAMSGAAAVAARGALRAGLGLLRIVSVPANREILQTLVPEAIFVDRTQRDELQAAIQTSDAVAIGPGLGLDAEAARLLEDVFDASDGRPLLLDADAITLAGQGGLTGIGAQRPILLTPHPGELERISRRSRAEIVSRRLEAATEVAREIQATVLLKGLPSVVVDPDAHALINTVGSSDLATGGMGDVLTGVAGAMLAQGVTPAEAAALALYYSGRAADVAGRGRALSPLDVVECLAGAFAEEGPGPNPTGLPFVVFDQEAPR